MDLKKIIENIKQNIKQKEFEVRKEVGESVKKDIINEILKSVQGGAAWIAAALEAAAILDGDEVLGRQLLEMAAPHVERAAKMYPRHSREVARAMIRAGMWIPALLILRQTGGYGEEDIPVARGDENKNKVYPGLLVWKAWRVRDAARRGAVMQAVKLTTTILKDLGIHPDPQAVVQALRGLAWENRGHLVRPSWVTQDRIAAELHNNSAKRRPKPKKDDARPQKNQKSEGRP